MKGQLPIIIALAIIMAIIISTTLYLSTIPVNVKYSYTGKQYSNWDVYDHELTQLLLYMLREGVSKATNTIEEQINKNLFIQNISEINVDAPLNVSLLIPFNYTFPLYVPVGKEYTAISPTYYSQILMSRLNGLATITLNTTAFQILKNWISTMKRMGIHVILNKFNTAYNMSLSVLGTTTVGKTIVSVNFTLTIFNSIGEYRVFKKVSILYSQENFTRGYFSGKDSVSGGFILPVTVQSYLVLDGVKYYYVLSSSDLTTYYYSPLFSILTSFASQYGGNQVVQAYVINNGQAAFYRGNGVTNFTTIIRYTTYNQFLLDWIKYIHFSSIIDLIKSNSLDWNNVFDVFNEMTWNLTYNASVYVISYFPIYGSSLAKYRINVTSINGINVQIIYYQASKIPKSPKKLIVNYTKVMNFYIPGYSILRINDIPVLIPTQFYIYYIGEYDAYRTLYTYSFSIRITG